MLVVSMSKQLLLSVKLLTTTVANVFGSVVVFATLIVSWEEFMKLRNITLLTQNEV